MPFSTDEEIDELARAFERLEIIPENFSHAAHLAVALRYLTSSPFAEATQRMRAGLLRLLAHHGIDEYHETITLFWMRLLKHYLEANGEKPLHAVANGAIERYGRTEYLFAHFSRDLIFSPAARQNWIEPDLRPLPPLAATSREGGPQT